MVAQPLTLYQRFQQASQPGAWIFLTQRDCAVFRGSCKPIKISLANDEQWQTSVVAPLHEIEKQFQALDPETRRLLRERAVYHPHPQVQAVVRKGVEQMRAVCDQIKTDRLPPQDAALVLRHAVTMTTYGCHNYVHPVLKELEGGVRGKGEVQILFENRIAVLTQGDKRVAKLLKVDAPSTWKNARDYTQDTLNLNMAAHKMMAAMGSFAVAPVHQLQDGTVAMHFIPNSTTIYEMTSKDNDAIQKLRTINQTEAQMHMLMHLIRGRSDGHAYNTVVALDPKGAFHLFDIDEEHNFIATNLDVKEGGGEESSYATVFGLPQGGQPLPKTLLRLFSCEGWKEKCLTILAQSNLSNAARACAQRCDKIRGICLAELQRKNSRITSRDFYFAIFGKDYLYEKALRNRVPPMTFFISLVREYDDYRPDPWNAIDLQGRTYEKLETLPPLPRFSMHQNEQYPGGNVLRHIANNLWKSPSIRCVEIPSAALDFEGWTQYQREHPSDSIAMQSFMLSHFLQGFPKRMARQLSELYPYFPLNITREEKKSCCRGRKLWLEITPSPLLINFHEMWRKNTQRLPIEVMKLESNQVSLAHLKKIRPSNEDLTKYRFDLSPCLSGEIQLCTKLIYDRHRNGYLDIEQRHDGLFLVFKYYPDN